MGRRMRSQGSLQRPSQPSTPRLLPFLAPSPASDLAALPADAAAQPTPSPEAAGSLAAPLQLSRDLQPWSQDRVNDLIAAGTVKASWLPDIQAVVPEKLLIQR